MRLTYPFDQMGDKMVFIVVGIGEDEKIGIGGTSSSSIFTLCLMISEGAKGWRET